MLSPEYIPGFSALAGTLIGGFTSMATTWLGQKHKSREEERIRNKTERQELYKQFIQEASGLYADALEHEQTEIPQFIGIYALLNLIYISSSPRVFEEADNVLRVIIETYPKERKTFQDLLTLKNRDVFDLLHPFSEACRDDLG